VTIYPTVHVPGGTATVDLNSDTICFRYNLHTNNKMQYSAWCNRANWRHVAYTTRLYQI